MGRSVDEGRRRRRRRGVLDDRHLPGHGRVLSDLQNQSAAVRTGPAAAAAKRSDRLRRSRRQLTAGSTEANWAR